MYWNVVEVLGCYPLLSAVMILVDKFNFEHLPICALNKKKNRTFLILLY